ncbi:hypothetical protein HPB52_008307 [Rhipicephalus sanguineus]|uniref:CCHC-type domain-containing protein n=1 Tax=Rhipicephalus sanguineus TaxID=34632 RepID=A0A9D4T3C6_RHISA|nr:hypothetical protein HPB52_008307 [Rhipicephalus sanguineus]
MPQLPREDTKIVIRPRGGLSIVKTGSTVVADAILAATSICTEDLRGDMLCPNVEQNIIFASTPRRENAARYVRVRQIIVLGRTYELVNERNPLALAAKRIGSTGTVIVAFDGHRVPIFVRYGPTLVRCSLYRKKIDICYACGQLRHRADLCPSPGDVVCRGCGASNPDSQHQCTPKCRLCGDQHLTADKDCAETSPVPPTKTRPRYHRHTPRTGRTSGSHTAPGALPGAAPGPEEVPEEEGAATSLGAAPGLPGTDTVREGPPKVVSGSLPERAESAREIAQLKSENAKMRETINRLMSEISEIKNARNPPPQPANAYTLHAAPQLMEAHASEEGSSSSNGQSAPKKRAVAYEQDGVANRVKCELRDTLSALSESIKQLEENFAQLQVTLAAQNDRVSKVESFLENVVAPALTLNADIQPQPGLHAPVIVKIHLG